MSLYRLRNIFIFILLVLAAFLLQGTVFSRIPVLQCAPNILLVLTFVFGYCRGKISGMLVGFFGGLLMDTFFCDVIGYHALVLLVIGFISGIWNTWFYSDDLYVPLLLLILSDLFYCIQYYLFWYLLRARFEFGYVLLHIILPEFILTFLAGALLYKPLSLLLERLGTIPEQ